MSFRYTERIYPAGSPSSDLSFDELAATIGAGDPSLWDVYAAFGLTRPGRRRAMTEDEERILPAFFRAWASDGISPDASIRAARLLGDAARRAAHGWVALFSEEVAPPPAASAAMTLDELGPRVLEPGIRIAQLIEPAMVWLLRRYLEQALDELNVEAMERALEAHGLRPRIAADPPAIVFADLSGFTRLTEELGDHVAVRHASTLASLADAAARDHGGTLVKQLGDGVMLAFRRAADALDAAVALRRSAADAALPPVHVGLSAGPVIERDGDYFGRTVNLASRISGAAGPGEILVDSAVAGAASDLAFVEVGPIELKGLSGPISLLRLEGTG